MGSGLVKIGICRHEQAEAKKDQSWSSQAPTAIAGQACSWCMGLLGGICIRWSHGSAKQA